MVEGGKRKADGSPKLVEGAAADDAEEMGPGDDEVVIVPVGKVKARVAYDEYAGFSSATKNLIPRSSTSRVKVVGRVVWVQRPGVCATGAQPWGCRLRTKRF